MAKIDRTVVLRVDDSFKAALAELSREMTRELGVNVSMRACTKRLARNMKVMRMALKIEI